MLRTLLISIFIVSFLPGAAAQTGRQDYTDQLVKLVQLTDNKQYRDAIIGYRNLEAQPETPGWLRAASEYEIAELYGTLNEPDNAIAALSRGRIAEGGNPPATLRPDYDSLGSPDAVFRVDLSDKFATGELSRGNPSRGEAEVVNVTFVWKTWARNYHRKRSNSRHVAGQLQSAYSMGLFTFRTFNLSGYGNRILFLL